MGKFGNNLGQGIYGKRDVSQPSTSKKRVVVFAEAPSQQYYISNKTIDDSAPKELKDLWNEYNSTKLGSPYINESSMLQEKKDYYKNNRSSTPEQDSKFNTYISKKYTNPDFVKNETRRRELATRFDEKNNSLNNPTWLDKTFITEAENVKKFYANNPNVTVEIIPTYDKGLNKQAGLNEYKNKLSQLSADDDVVIFGHSGEMLGGINNKDLSDSFAKSASKNLFIGSCNFGEHINEGYKTSGKNVYYRNDKPWLGFNPEAKTFIDGMYSRNIASNQALTDFANNNTPLGSGIIKNVKEGKEFNFINEPLPILKPKVSTGQLWNGGLNSFKPL